MPFLIVFIVLALIEIAAFDAVSDEIGGLTALLLLIISAIAGSFLLRYQGLQAIMALRQSMERGKVPVNSFFEGFCITIAALLLITPGFVSDIFALLLLIPATRSFIRNTTQHYSQRYKETHPSNHDIIDGEYERIDDHDKIDRV